MAIFLILSIAFNTGFAACYKIAARRKSNLQVVNLWLYVGSTITMLAYVVGKRALLFNFDAVILGVVAGVMVFFATLTFFHHIGRGQLSSSWTVISLAVAFPVLASIFAWGEHPTPRQVVGLLLIVVALVLFGRHETRNGRETL